MTNPLLQIKTLLGGRVSPREGSVVSVQRGQIHVATTSGVLILPRTDATAYKSGDTVILKNGVLQGKRRDEASLPVFLV